MPRPSKYTPNKMVEVLKVWVDTVSGPSAWPSLARPLGKPVTGSVATVAAEGTRNS